MNNISNKLVILLFYYIGEHAMTRNEALDKVRQFNDDSKRKMIIERRIQRLENLMNEEDESIERSEKMTLVERYNRNKKTK